ncbi:LacI family DNA-binding transcriptional regulator [Arthrobacter sp. SD76]|uniref:LacI family DNA-binding transcriptional regulator n=1 Tax=Arthrobacter sp. SD76 TaxID=3415007 RepID=UPI003C70943B
MVTMHDVAAHAGVSASTVSRVFRNEESVSKATRKRVNDAMAALNYVPNMMARTFREGKASLLAIAVPSIADSFFASVIEGADSIAKTHGHAIAVTSLGDDPSRERPIVEALLRRQISSLVLVPIASDQSYLSTWLPHTPVVVIDREATGADVDVFLEDDRGGAIMAVDHLLRLGHQRIAFLGADDAVATTARRFDGYRQAIQDAGLSVEDQPVLFAGPSHIQEGIAGMLGAQDPPTALFSSNARTSVVVVRALQALKARGLAMVSFGDFPMADALDPSVSVIDQDPFRLGQAAAERALNRVADPEGSFENLTVFDVNLIPRGSSTPPSRA